MDKDLTTILVEFDTEKLSGTTFLEALADTRGQADPLLDLIGTLDLKNDTTVIKILKSAYVEVQKDPKILATAMEDLEKTLLALEEDQAKIRKLLLSEEWAQLIAEMIVKEAGIVDISHIIEQNSEEEKLSAIR